MMNTLFVMAGGAIGAAMRYELGRLSVRMAGPNAAWPWGTFAANILGGFAMGLFAGWLAARAQGGESLRLFIAVGILGGFTTFSSFSLETLMMIERGQWLAAGGYALGSVVASVGALALGLGLMRGLA